jgi:TfoX/Sxy family transcriptional regulator of competence genes
MAYDEELAERVRVLLAPRAAFEERKMFGGLAFMVNTHMACGIVREDLMVRVGKDGHESALREGAQEMDFTGRPMRGMVVVAGSKVAGSEALEHWVIRAAQFALSEPPKKQNPPKRKR